LWTLGAYDVVLLLEAPDDETMSAFMLKNWFNGKRLDRTMRAFPKDEMAKILAKDQIGNSAPSKAKSGDFLKSALTSCADPLGNLDYVIRRLDALSTA
jgi:hypothetical protein